jgi:hypothetical protein
MMSTMIQFIGCSSSTSVLGCVVVAGYPASQVQDMLSEPGLMMSARYLDGDIMHPQVRARMGGSPQ